LLKIASVVATIPACFLIFSGGFVLARFAAVHAVGDLMMYGALPLFGGACWLILAAWFWSRAVGASSLWDSIGVVSLRALGAIALAAVGAIVLEKFRGR
jgi:hypothetical protein